MEPELMEDPEQAEAYAHADFSASDERFVSAFTARFASLEPGPVVDLGCGPGNIALRLAAALPQREVHGVDGSAAMLAIARRSGAVHGERLRLIEARLPTEALATQSYAAIVSNSLLHHLPNPVTLWQTVGRIGKPGAAVFIGDLRRPATPEAARALVDRYARSDPDVLRADFLASLHAAFEADEVRSQLLEARLDLSVEEVDDRYLWIWGRLPL
ncbi:MAG: class I SAM-dependent methyltransferase [Myxococcales bacterium]|nr:class I SAM-dependent methyltransferase [Myxococcales bacterium]